MSTPPRRDRTLTCRTVAEGSLRQSNYIRDLPAHTLTSVGSGPLNPSPNGLETLLAALGSCLAGGIQATALARHIVVRELELTLSGNVRDFTEDHDGVGGFESILVAVRITADEAKSVIEAFVTHAFLRSPVANTLFNPINIEVSVAGHEASHL